ncbi:hypothetical protein C4K13_2722 [Pseudomonas chlororaphis subsp. aureofaciens]|nr:hypothetical protein C4K13_2722 [Pseudomonas chlororaphis subsp. aureofaciens]AZD98579.1 hypothetical protein C4K12_2713 [Pseudomonas chlororaphis subsp. aureofaciens]
MSWSVSTALSRIRPVRVVLQIEFVFISPVSRRESLVRQATSGSFAGLLCGLCVRHSLVSCDLV